jgi:hypothetical protein
MTHPSGLVSSEQFVVDRVEVLRDLHLDVDAAELER